MSQNRPNEPQPPARVQHSMYAQGKIFQSTTPLPISTVPEQFVRADLEFIDVDHAGPSFEARVFVNNPGANISTPPMESYGFAGCFNVFGHGGCFGDAGHCEIHGRHEDNFDPRPSHPLIPMKKVVIATSAIRKALNERADIHVTVVPIIKSWTEKSDVNDILRFDHINLITYR
ncbi:MAG: hypothetical protein LC794_08370 [Acidobacteria bacterium]|nr:hypothetical protein [Acidobacteriota bacterium]